MIFTPLLVILAAATGVAALFNHWMTREEKTHLQKRIERTASQVEKAGPVTIVQLPLRLLDATYHACFDKRPTRRIGIVSALLLTAALGVTGLFTGRPFGMSQPPWTAFEDEVNQIVASLEKTEKEARETGQCVTTADDHVLGSLALGRRLFGPLRYPYAKWVFTIALSLFVAAVTVFLSRASFGMSRRILRAVLTTQEPILVAGGLLLAAGVGFVLSGVAILPLVTLVDPRMVFPLFGSFMLSFLSPSLAIGTLVGSVGVAWEIGSPWVRVVAITAVASNLLVCLLAAGSLIVFPFRGQVHYVLAQMARRAAKFEQGVLVLAGGTTTALAAIIGALALALK